MEHGADRHSKKREKPHFETDKNLRNHMKEKATNCKKEGHDNCIKSAMGGQPERCKQGGERETSPWEPRQRQREEGRR